MKKIMKYLIIFALCIPLTGCADRDLLNDSSILNYGFNETAQFDNLAFTAVEIVEMKFSDDYILKPKKGKVYISVKFDIENISDEKQSVSSLGMFKVYVDGNADRLSIFGSTALDEEIVDGVIEPGNKKTGWFTVEIPDDWQELKIFVKSSVLSNDYVQFTYSK